MTQQELESHIKFNWFVTDRIVCAGWLLASSIHIQIGNWAVQYGQSLISESMDECIQVRVPAYLSIYLLIYLFIYFWKVMRVCSIPYSIHVFHPSGWVDETGQLDREEEGGDEIESMLSNRFNYNSIRHLHAWWIELDIVI